MSTIKANDIQNASGGIPTVKGQRLIPTAWVNFDGTGTVAIRASENVSSITDEGTGMYTVNFANAMVDADFAAIGSCSSIGGSRSGTLTFNVDLGGSLVTPTSSSIRMLTNYTNTNYDPAYLYVSILGGQA
jgi:hypothetical protein